LETAAIALDHSRTELAGSFAARFERLRPRLTAICRAVVGPDDAPDLVQDAYLRASERLHQLRDLELFDAWVVRIALNEANALLRRRRPAGDLHPGIEATDEQSGDVGLRQLVERLPPRDRAVIVLHYGYGYRMGEISRLLNLSEVNVRTIAFRARRWLRARLEEAGR
jgi:RNA polymerase sigma-70 factor (ECF subfamily)